MGSRKDGTGNRSSFRIGDIVVHPDRYVIIREGVEVSLAPKTMDLLVELAEANGKPVSRDDLLKSVWKNQDLDDNAINKAVSELRDKLGDDHVAAPRYIKTVRKVGSSKGGYRLIPPVIFEKGYRRRGRQDCTWSDGSPYVGLAAFDAHHANVFFGRRRMQEKVLEAMRAQLDNGSRLVLLHGASGSGKTSLLRAGVIPKLMKPSDNDDLHALAVAHCDLASAQPGDVIRALATALATWTLGNRPVFPPQSIDEFKRFLAETPHRIGDFIDEAFRHNLDQKVAKKPFAHLLLVIDHGEKLVDSMSDDTSAQESFSRAIEALCESEHTLTTMVVRGDCYLKLQETLPDLIERKGSDGHIDILRPSPGEIAEIIRYPAECARLDFEQDPDGGVYLDDQLIDDAKGKPDVLPLLQHTLRQLYELRDAETGMLTFAAYRAMGGLEGAIAHRADEVFSALSPEARESLDYVLSKLFVIKIDSEAIKRGGLSLDAFYAPARALINAFIDARLFVSEKGDQGRPCFGVAHEALLRRWPKALDWSRKNQRLLKARVDLKVAADRWHDNGRRKDHLLNPGIPLIEANEIANEKGVSLSEEETDLIRQSNRQRVFNLRLRRIVIAGLVVLSVVSISMAMIAAESAADAELQRDYAAKSNTLVIGEIADRMDANADSELIKKITGVAIEYCEGLDIESTGIDELISCSRAYRKLGEVQISQSDHRSALANIDRSVRLSEKALGKAPESIKTLTEAGEAESWRGIALRRAGDLNGAISAWQAYLRHTEKLVARHSTDPMSHLQMSYALTNLGLAEIELGHYKQALDLLSRSERLKKSPSARRDKKREDDAYELAVTSSFICNIYAKTGRLSEAKKCYLEQIVAVRTLLKARSDANDWRRQLANFLRFHAESELDLGNPIEAKNSIDDAINQYRLLLSADPDNDDWALYSAQAHLLAGEIARAKGDLASAQTYFRFVEQSASSRPKPSKPWTRLLVSAQFKLSRYGSNRPDAKGMSAAIASFKALHHSDKSDKKTGLALAEMLVSHAEYYRSIGDGTSSKLAALEAIRLLKQSKALGQEDERFHLSLDVRAHFSAGELQQACVLASNKALIEHQHIDYVSMPLSDTACPSI